MRHYGLELEFFITDKDGLVPAFKVDDISTDGNPIIGELRTGVFDSLTKAIFDLKRLIFETENVLIKKELNFKLIPKFKVNDEFIKNIRKSQDYRNFLGKKEYNEVLSIYGKENTSILPNNIFTASLQLNISENEKIVIYPKNKNDDYIYKDISVLFNYSELISKCDELFKENIKSANRVPGIYSIKNGNKGKRIEYRSLPNNIHLMHLLQLEQY